LIRWEERRMVDFCSDLEMGDPPGRPYKL